MHSFVQVMERPPHQCISCGGSSDREWYLDLGDSEINAEMLYAIYVCNLCFVAIAKDRDLVDRSPLDKEIEELKGKLFDATVKADGLEQGLDGLLRSRFIDPDSSVAVELVEFAQDAAKSDESSSGGEKPVRPKRRNVGKGKRADAKPSDDSDVAGLSTAFKLPGSSG